MRRAPAARILKWSLHDAPGGSEMVRYFYGFTPLAIVFGIATLVAAPPLALAVLAIGLFFGLAYLIRATIAGTHRVSHAVAVRWHAQAQPTPVPVLSFTMARDLEEHDA